MLGGPRGGSRVDRAAAGLPWVLEPKALPKFIECEPEQFAAEDVRLAAYHLSWYVRAKQAELAKTAGPARWIACAIAS